MAYNLVSKNNMGIVTTLILVILLSQSRFFDFLTETGFGRMVLLAFIIMISYTNKYLGLLSVLIIIIAFGKNNSNRVYAYNYYEPKVSLFEGFDSSGNSMDGSGNLVNNINAKKVAVNDSLQSTLMSNNIATDSTTDNTTDNINDNTTDNINDNTTDNAAKETFKGREGFCMSDRELNILRGKQSNTVPVFSNLREQGDGVNPSDKSVFSSDYASF